ncbi:hypothetical protein ACFYZJ_11285 [Streptomyces sp. NPDC001848]
MRWDSGRVTLYFSGPDAYAKHPGTRPASPDRHS